jgi:hypothetical protein
LTIFLVTIRGLIPTPNSHTCRCGSNTDCVEIYAALRRLSFDGGTGLRILGKTWQQQQPLEAPYQLPITSFSLAATTPLVSNSLAVSIPVKISGEIPDRHR